MPAMNPNGRIARHPPHRGDGENAEMKMYLSKLKDLVPFMPKNRKLSKLEIIQHVIDYICDLQTELETHPEINNFDAAAALSGVAAAAAAGGMHADDDDDTSDAEMDGTEDAAAAAAGVGVELAMRLAAEQEQLAKLSSPAAAVRIPLIDRQSPNTILPAANTVPAAAAAVQAAAATPAVQQQQQLSNDSLATVSQAPNTPTHTHYLTQTHAHLGNNTLRFIFDFLHLHCKLKRREPRSWQRQRTL